MGHLLLSLLGSFRAVLDGQPVTGFESNKVRALLAYLAVEADRPHPRSILAALLWPDWPDREALGHLRHALSNLRHILGDDHAPAPFLLVSREAIQFNPAGDYALDLSAFRNSAHPDGTSRPEQIIALYQGDFLEGFALGDSPAFEEWALLWRERLARKALEILHGEASACEGRGDYDRAEMYAHRQLDLEPWDEEAHRRLMRLLAFTDRRGAALAQYETCRRLLAQELGVIPSAETTTLYEQIRDGRLNRVTSSRPSPAVVSPPPRFLSSGGYHPPSAPPPFVAREREMARLNHFLDLALAGQGQVIFVTGGPGSGKTALAQEFVRRALEAHPHLAAAQGNGNAYTGQGDPYLPFLEILQMLTGNGESARVGGAVPPEQSARLRQLCPTTVAALFEVGSDLPGRFISIPEPPGRTQTVGVPLEQTHLFEQYTQVLRAVAGQVPLLLVLDDLQWADAGSVNLLFHLGRKTAGSRILIVGVYRPGDVASGRGGERHPLEPVINEFQREWGDIGIDLAQTENRPFVEALLDAEPNCLEADFRELLYRHTDGQALFTVELLRGLQDRGDLLRDEAGRWMVGPTLAWDRLPARIEAVIAEQFGRLPRVWQTLLTVAGVEGEEFTAEAIACAQGIDEQTVIEGLSGDLAHRYHWVSAVGCRQVNNRRLSRYRFRHYLFQKYLYHRSDEVERARYHEAMGNALESLYGDQAGEIAVALAYHFEQAGVVGKAVGYLMQAAQRAVQLAAHQEAIAHLNRGLELLQNLSPSPERDRQELALQLALGVALITFQGYGTPETSRAYARAQQLSRQIDQPAEVFTALLGMASFYAVRAEYQTALALSEQLFAVAQQNSDPAQLAAACCIKGYSFLGLGDFVRARPVLEQILSLYDAPSYRAMFYASGIDMRIYSLVWLSVVLLPLGYPDRARQHSRIALAEQELEHPFSIATVLAIAGAIFNSLYGDNQTEWECTEKLIGLGSRAPGFFQGFGTLYLGRQKLRAGQVEAGLALMHQGLSILRTIGHMSHYPHALSLLAEAYAQADQSVEALRILGEALALVETTGERFYEAELYRLRGELWLRQGQTATAEASFRQALEIARRQEAKLWELRAAMSLARLRQKQGRSAEARQSLAEIYGWFTEGFDAPDLIEARELLNLR